MNLQTVMAMFHRVPHVIPTVEAAQRKRRGKVKQQRRGKVKQQRRERIYDELVKTPNIKQSELITLCMKVGIADESTIRSDLLVLKESGRVAITSSTRLNRQHSYNILAV